MQRRNAARLKATLAYRATLEDHQRDLIAVVEQDIKALRMQARGGQDRNDLRESLFQQMAKAEFTLDRAHAHLALAQERRDSAMAEVSRLESELRELEMQMPPQTKPDFPGLAALAGLLTSLRAGAVDSGAGLFTVDGGILERMVSQIQRMAAPAVQPAPPTPAARSPSVRPPSVHSPVRTPSPPPRKLWADMASTDEDMPMFPNNVAGTSFSETISEDSPSDTELRAYYKRFVRGPRSAQHRALVSNRIAKLSHKKKQPPAKEAMSALSPVREHPSPMKIYTPERARPSVPDMPDDF